jgi:DNA helicase HerA-like ATPase
MSIDEAHYYFPQEGAREDFNKVEAVINKLTRLGRMGVVFAAHSPVDLNVTFKTLPRHTRRREL